MKLAEERKRVKRVNVRLNNDIVEKLDGIATRLGVPPATLAAMAIGEYVNQKVMQREMLNKTSSMMADRAMGAVEGLVDDPRILETFANVVSGIEAPSP